MAELNQEVLNAREEIAHIFPEEFFVDYITKEKEDGTSFKKAVEKVTWAKKGQHIMTGQRTTMRISQARKDRTIWPAIEPHYNAWKNKQEAPVDGTPLSAWPDLTTDHAKRLTLLNVKSVEDVAKMTDADIDAYGMGGMQLRMRARAFVEAKKDRTFIQAEVTSQLSAMQSVIDGLRAELAAKDAPPKRGRPPKQEAA